MTLSHERTGEEEGNGKSRSPPKGTAWAKRVDGNVREQKKVGLYREGSWGKGTPVPEMEKFRVGSGVCQSGGLCNRKRLKDAGRIWQLVSTLIS